MSQNLSGRHYGELDTLLEQYRMLQKRFEDTLPKDEITKWLMMCTKSNLYKGISDILHLALCCFVKAPLEATAETIGSVINQHGNKGRCSLLPSSLSNEVQIAWNGLEEFQTATTDLIREALYEYFEGKKTGLRFYINTKLKLMSTTIRDNMAKRSRIYF